MFRFLSVAALALGVAAIPSAARAQTTQQTLVDRATLTVQDLFLQVRGDDPLRLIRRAKGVMVCPEVFRASFLFGGSGGACVLAARNSVGGWSYPAFYGMLSGSFGLQAGIQDVELLMIILTDRGLAAVMDSQFKFGGDASLTFATLGTGIEGATTADLGADIVVIGKSRGLFAGLSLQGSVLTSRTPWNQAYYGQGFAARQITLQGMARNQGAEPLRDMLSHYSGAGPQASAYMPPPPSYAPAQGAPIQLAPPAPRASIQQQNLPPPR